MRLSDFVLLSVEEKKHSVLHQGVLVAKRAEPGHLLLLFQMDGFYVEALCHIESKMVVGYNAFLETKHLDAYLTAIPLDELLR